MSIHLRFEKERMTVRKQVDYIIPERLEEARIFRGMTTKEVAEEMGITPSEYRELESFNCPQEKLLPKMFDLMRVLGFPKGWFYVEVWKRMP